MAQTDRGRSWLSPKCCQVPTITDPSVLMTKLLSCMHERNNIIMQVITQMSSHPSKGVPKGIVRLVSITSGLFSDCDSCIHGSAPTLPFVSCISTQFHNAMLNNFSYINQEHLAYFYFIAEFGHIITNWMLGLDTRGKTNMSLLFIQ